MKNKKIFLTTLASGLVATFALIGCNNGGGNTPTATPYVGVYGADDLDYKIFCDGKENNLQYGKDVTVEFTPKLIEKEAVRAAFGMDYYASLNEITHKPVGEDPYTDLATKPYVGYGNKTYHPYDYRLTEGLSYTWKQDETNKEKYILKIPGDNFKKNIIVSFDDTLWNIEKMFDQTGDQAGVTYPLFTNDAEEAAESKKEYYCGINAYNINDLVEDDYQYSFSHSKYTDYSRYDLLHYEFSDESSNEITNMDSKRIDDYGPTFVFETNGYKFGSQSNLSTANFKIVATKADGSTVDLQTSAEYYVSLNLIYVTLPWNVLYKTETTQEGKTKVVKIYNQSIKFEKAETNKVVEFKPGTSDDYVSYFRSSYYYHHVVPRYTYYKNQHVESPDVLDFEKSVEKFIKAEDHTIEKFPNISLVFKAGNNTKTIKFDEINAKELDDFYFGTEKLTNVKYKESEESGWCITYFYNETTSTPHLQLVPKSYLSYYYPGTTTYANTLTVTYTAPAI